MNKPDENFETEFALPINVITKPDLARLVIEAEKIDYFLNEKYAREKVGVFSEEQITMSEQMAGFMTVNKLQFGDSGARTSLIQRLRKLKEEAPVLHITFAQEVDRESLGKVADWLRQNISPAAVLRVGLQPDLIGGIYIRTANKVHDMSIRAQLANNRHLITEAVESLNAN